jgi:hypothetical protein
MQTTLRTKARTEEEASKAPHVSSACVEKAWISRRYRPIARSAWVTRNGALFAGAVWAALGMTAVVAAVVAAEAQGDYGVISDAWNSLTELVRLGRASGAPVTATTRLDLSKLTPRDGLLVVFPSDEPPREDLAAFLHDGGRIAIADDFGAAEGWLGGFAIRRARLPAGATAPRLRGNRNVLIAEPSAAHPLSRDVRALVVNHPAVLQHAELAPVMELAGGGAVVLAGAVGQGRLVVLSDPSALINNMLELSGNRRFATNLLGYLGQGGGQVFIVAGDARFAGRYGELAKTEKMARLKSALDRVARVKLPEGTLRVLSAMLAVAMLLAALSAVPRRTQYLAAMRRTRPPSVPVFAGDAGVLAYFASAGEDAPGASAVRNLLVPLLRYRHGFEHALAERLSLEPGTRGRPSVHTLIDAASRSGLTRDQQAELKGLLDELANMAIGSENPSPPYVTERKFRAAVGSGERMLSALEALAARRRRS